MMAKKQREIIIMAMREFDLRTGNVHSELYYEAMSWNGLDKPGTKVWDEFIETEQGQLVQTILENEKKVPDDPEFELEGGLDPDVAAKEAIEHNGSYHY